MLRASVYDLSTPKAHGISRVLLHVQQSIEKMPDSKADTKAAEAKPGAEKPAAEAKPAAQQEVAFEEDDFEEFEMQGEHWVRAVLL